MTEQDEDVLMYVRDPICGTAEISEPVLLDLLETRALRRLNGIRTLDPDVALNGAVQPLSAFDPEFTAYRQAYLERKRGCWSIRELGAPDKETP